MADKVSDAGRRNAHHWKDIEGKKAGSVIGKLQ